MGYDEYLRISLILVLYQLSRANELGILFLVRTIDEKDLVLGLILMIDDKHFAFDATVASSRSVARLNLPSNPTARARRFGGLSSGLRPAPSRMPAPGRFLGQRHAFAIRPWPACSPDAAVQGTSVRLLARGVPRGSSSLPTCTISASPAGSACSASRLRPRPRRTSLLESPAACFQCSHFGSSMLRRASALTTPTRNSTPTDFCDASAKASVAAAVGIRPSAKRAISRARRNRPASARAAGTSASPLLRPMPDRFRCVRQPNSAATARSYPCRPSFRSWRPDSRPIPRQSAVRSASLPGAPAAVALTPKARRA